MTDTAHLFRAGDGNGVFTNRSSLIMTANVPSSYISMEGALVNFGTINTYANLTLARNVANEASFNLGDGYAINMSRRSFNQDAGTLGTFGDTHFVMNNGIFNFNGGTIYLTVDLYNSTLGVNVPDGQGVAFNSWNNVYLSSNIPANTSLYSIADSTHGGAAVYAPANAVNYGSMTLVANDGYSSGIQAGDGSSTFYNNGYLAILRNTTTVPHLLQDRSSTTASSS